MLKPKYPCRVAWIAIGLALGCQLDRKGRLVDAAVDSGVDAAHDAVVDGALHDSGDDASDTNLGPDVDAIVVADARSDGSTVDAADAGSCSFSQPQCDGNDLLACVASGLVRTACNFGCQTDSNGGHCANVVPSNVETEVPNPWGGTYDLVIDVNKQRLIRTPMNQITDLNGGNPITGPMFNNVHDNANNTDYTVIRLRSLTVRSGGTLYVRGYQPAIFLVSGNVSIDTGGRILAGASQVMFANDQPPAGGGVGAEPGSDPSQDGLVGAPANAGGGGGGTHGDNGRDSGGAGGSFGTLGGPGGQGTTGAGNDESGGSGTVAPYNANLIPLRGGGGGGSGGNNDGGRGGSGGGALQISSATAIYVANGGLIDSSGEGGRGGRGGSINAGAGGGGGAGGGILLEAPTVSIMGIVSVIGGAGGRGMNPDSGSAGIDPLNGSHGYAIPLLAMGVQYAPTTTGMGDGGEGGQSAQASHPLWAARSGGGALNGGGGGGGNGVIHIRTRNGQLTPPQPSPQSGLYPPLLLGATTSSVVIN